MGETFHKNSPKHWRTRAVFNSYKNRHYFIERKKEALPIILGDLRLQKLPA